MNRFREFLEGKNTILTKNEDEFKFFLELLLKNRIRINQFEKHSDWWYWQYIAMINDKDKEFKGYLLWEYSKGGITFWTSIEKSKEWYHKNPIYCRELGYTGEEIDTPGISVAALAKFYEKFH